MSETRGRRPRAHAFHEAADPPGDVDPMLLEVWQHLSSVRDTAAASAFFQRFVVDGTEYLAQIQACSGAAPAASAPLVRLGEGRPKTEVNLARHREILDRKFLVTGYVLVMPRGDGALRRIPLNYRRIRMGTPAPRQDIVLELADGDTYLARLELEEGRFIMHHRYGTVPTLVNGKEIESMPIGDGDTIRVGPCEMRIFKLLEPPAELLVVNGPGAGERFLIDTSEVTLGRRGKRINDINLSSPTVSREHARLLYKDGRFWLVPETSASPTAINGVSIDEPRRLGDNDQIVMGEVTLTFRTRHHGQLEDLEPRVATVLFFDLRGWTSVAESTALQDLIMQANEYYVAMGEIVHRYGGTLMTYQGDAIMAIFGAPSAHADDPWRAVAAALRMMREMETLSRKWTSEGKSALRGGIGIHTGQVIVGELGHSSRREYSALGDATNVAARLEELTKEMQCAIIISDSTWREVSTVVNARPLGTVTVKGRSSPTEIFEVLALNNLEASDTGSMDEPLAASPDDPVGPNDATSTALVAPRDVTLRFDPSTLADAEVPTDGSTIRTRRRRRRDAPLST